jgi:hypothetical protein
MCLPTKSDQRSSPTAGSGTRSLLGMGGLMLLACFGGPALAGAVVGGLGNSTSREANACRRTLLRPARDAA